MVPTLDSSGEDPIEGALTAQNMAVCAMVRTHVQVCHWLATDSELDYFILKSFNVMDYALCINMK